MAKTNDTKSQRNDREKARQRRALLKKLGRFTAVTAPTVTLLLAAQAKPGRAAPISPVCTPRSSRVFKIKEDGADTKAILRNVTSLPVELSPCKPESGLEHHTRIGPSAEDFKAAFGVGDGVTISPIDAVGVCLAAIQALSAKVNCLEAHVQASRPKKAA